MAIELKTCSLLLEIGTEELPAIPFLAELPNIEAKLHKILQNHRLDCSFAFYYTPRRLVILAPNFPAIQDAQTIEFFGPPLQIAYKDNAPTQAALGFFKKCDILENAVQTIVKDNKEVLYCKKEAPQNKAEALLETIVKEFLESLNFGKTMRWGSLQESFIRPISWILCLLDDKLVPLSLYNISSKAQTYVHRNVSFEPFPIKNTAHYLEVLENNGVILDQKVRKEKILNAIKQIEKDKNIQVEIDTELLEEVVAITEYPTALLGEFSSHFLELPAPCIITSMKVNQRYFATYKDNHLYHGFIVVSNSLSKDFGAIINGNLKVLNARLEDALFFYHNDLKNGFMPEKLKEVTFVEGLGSMWDKMEREKHIAKVLVASLQNYLQKEMRDSSIAQITQSIETAVHLSKADLMSEMVYEFTELQGIMGYYYAKALNYDENIAIAIKEQYLPNTEESALPSTLFSACVALAYKLDNLLGLFSLNKIPSGSRDPFALRRAANGVIKIILHFKIPFSLTEILNALSAHYKAFDITLLEHFILERLESILDFNPSLLRAVLATKERDIMQIITKLNALNTALNTQDKQILMQTFKRLANITKEVDLQSDLIIKEESLLASEEIELFNAYKQAITQNSDYTQLLQNLLALNPILERFFDKVLVNAPDPIFRDNRKHLIARIYKAFLEIADIKEISL